MTRALEGQETDLANHFLYGGCIVAKKKKAAKKKAAKKAVKKGTKKKTAKRKKKATKKK